MVILEVNLTKPIAPDKLPALLDACRAALPAGGTEGVVLSGRLPVWAYGALVHEYHPRPWVATFDPRLGGAVVVMSHTDIPIGDILNIDDAEKIVIDF